MATESLRDIVDRFPAVGLAAQHHADPDRPAERLGIEPVAGEIGAPVAVVEGDGDVRRGLNGMEIVPG